MNKSTSPVLFVFINGMWERPLCWAFLKKNIEANGYSCVAPCLKYHHGNVNSPHSNLGTTSILDYVEKLEKRIKSIRAKYPDHKLVLIGHSMGGLISQILLSRKPDYYGAGIFITPAPPAGIFALRLSVLQCFSEHLRWGCWKKPFKLSEKKFTYAMFLTFSKSKKEKIIKNLQYESGRAAAEIGFWQIDKIIRFLSGKGWKAATSVNFDLPHKMLFVGAQKDKITPVSSVKETAGRYPQAQFKEIPKEPHYILENKITLKLILEFMKNELMKEPKPD